MEKSRAILITDTSIVHPDLGNCSNFFTLLITNPNSPFFGIWVRHNLGQRNPTNSILEPQMCRARRGDGLVAKIHYPGRTWCFPGSCLPLLCSYFRNQVKENVTNVTSFLLNSTTASAVSVPLGRKGGESSSSNTFTRKGTSTCISRSPSLTVHLAMSSYLSLSSRSRRCVTRTAVEFSLYRKGTPSAAKQPQHTQAQSTPLQALMALILFCSSVNPFGHHDCTITQTQKWNRRNLCGYIRVGRKHGIYGKIPQF